MITAAVIVNQYITLFQMLKNSTENLPLTPLKLNYYLSQHKKQKLQPQLQSQHSYHHIESQRDHINISPIRRTEKPIRVQENDNIFRNDNVDEWSRLEKKRKVNIGGRREVFSINVMDGSFVKHQNQQQQQGHGCNDSLDQLMTQRSYGENPSVYMNQSSILTMSPSKNNVQFFTHHKTQKQPKPILKKVNWNIQPLKHARDQKHYRQEIDQNFKQISRELSKITYQLNSNSRKLQQMNKLYHEHEYKRSDPQESIRRANLKYSIKQEGKENERGFRVCPSVEYVDRMYRDPRFLIWQPQHSERNGNIFS